MTSSDPKKSKLSESHKARRQFLKNAIALGGLGAIASANPLGKPYAGADDRAKAVRGKPFKVLGADETIRIGVIGTGGMGTGHCHAIANLAAAGRANVQIVAVSDVAIPRMNDAAVVLSEKQGIEVAQYQDYRELLARDDIHGVLIATPEHWHADCAIDA
ncbi:MAG: NADH/NAD ratio-sensing transcriptional regulator Rex, partial [Planctomycetota bacterium]